MEAQLLPNLDDWTRPNSEDLLAALRGPDADDARTRQMDTVGACRDVLNYISVINFPNHGQLANHIVSDFQDSCLRGVDHLAPKFFEFEAVRELMVNRVIPDDSAAVLEVDRFVEHAARKVTACARDILFLHTVEMLDRLRVFFDLIGQGNGVRLSVETPSLSDLAISLEFGSKGSDPKKILDEFMVALSPSAAGQRIRYPLVHMPTERHIREEVTHYLTWTMGYWIHSEPTSTPYEFNAQDVEHFAWYESVATAVHMVFAGEEPRNCPDGEAKLRALVEDIWKEARNSSWGKALEPRLPELLESEVRLEWIGHIFGNVMGPVIAEVISDNPSSLDSTSILFPRSSETSPFDGLSFRLK